MEAMGVFDVRKSLQMGISPFPDDGHTNGIVGASCAIQNPYT
jgi:hypothetical protein